MHERDIPLRRGNGTLSVKLISRFLKKRGKESKGKKERERERKPICFLKDQEWYSNPTWVAESLEPSSAASQDTHLELARQWRQAPSPGTLTWDGECGHLKLLPDPLCHSTRLAIESQEGKRAWKQE